MSLARLPSLHASFDPVAYARTVVVSSFAMALISAGQALPL